MTESTKTVPQVMDFHLGWDGSIVTVLRSPWWSRAWICQEFIPSSQAYFMASFEYMHWESMGTTVEVCHDVVHGSRRIFPNGSFQFPTEDVQSPCGQWNCFACAIRYNKPAFQKDKRRAERLLTARKQQLNRSEDLLSTLFDVHLCEASDPRDISYASLALHKSHYGLRPSYSKANSVEKVLIDLANSLISHYGSLSILGIAVSTHQETTLYRSLYDILSDIPSWIPDWRSPPSVDIVIVLRKFILV
jgi:hypothetical protein